MAPQVRPQPPQSELLVLVSTHRSPQRVRPLSQLPPLLPPAPPGLPVELFFEHAPRHAPTNIAMPTITESGTAALSLLRLEHAIVVA
jgi:hypothetical protein